MATRYSAKVLLDDHGAFALYRLYRAEPAATTLVLWNDVALACAMTQVEQLLHRMEIVITAGDTTSAPTWAGDEATVGGAAVDVHNAACSTPYRPMG